MPEDSRLSRIGLFSDFESIPTQGSISHRITRSVPFEDQTLDKCQTLCNGTLAQTQPTDEITTNLSEITTRTLLLKEWSDPFRLAAAGVMHCTTDLQPVGYQC
jgi:hypothetical protein